MEIKIGVNNVPREINIESSLSADEVRQQLAQALADNGVLSLADEKGRTVMVPAERIAYLDLGQAQARTVGFGAL